MIETDVLIVGGSLVGLSTAAFLSFFALPNLSVERHHGTAIHPRAGHFHLRTLEVLRSVGLEGRVRAASEEQFDPDGGINAVELLAGREIATYIANLNEGVAAISPSTRLFMTEQSLKPLIRTRAEELGAAMRYATELVLFEQDAGGGVTAGIRNVVSGETDTVRARYMALGADGNRSPVRERLGIGTSGHGLLANLHHHLLPRRLRLRAARPESRCDLCLQSGPARVLPSGADRRFRLPRGYDAR